MKYLIILIFLCSCRSVAYKERYCQRWHNTTTMTPKTFRHVKRYMRDSSRFTNQAPVKEYQRDIYLINQFWNK